MFFRKKNFEAGLIGAPGYKKFFSGKILRLGGIFLEIKYKNFFQGRFFPGKKVQEIFSEKKFKAGLKNVLGRC